MVYPFFSMTGPRPKTPKPWRGDSTRGVRLVGSPRIWGKRGKGGEWVPREPKTSWGGIGAGRKGPLKPVADETTPPKPGAVGLRSP